MPVHAEDPSVVRGRAKLVGVVDERLLYQFPMNSFDGVDRVQHLPEVDLVAWWKSDSSEVHPAVAVVEEFHEAGKLELLDLLEFVKFLSRRCFLTNRVDLVKKIVDSDRFLSTDTAVVIVDRELE
uniref:Uncharacterized protein n=1 Tax=Strombidium inclinatum TaxID=197538 RepID=A0A7S3IQJ7_9SPIT|mmetsp:Transcript_3402/g.5107  ORF Transcript_3402/g.5107 Transcript_3402/m.5107 type:complete len:125 (+) Transcript_3402:157-531(+)